MSYNPSNLGHISAPNPVKKILKRHGIEPAPESEKHTSWATFLKAHWSVMAATDFYTVEVWTLRGPSDLLRIVCYAPRNAFRARRRSNHGTQRCIHETGGSKPDRRRRWFSVRQRVSHHGSRKKVPEGIQSESEKRGCDACSVSGTGS